MKDAKSNHEIWIANDHRGYPLKCLITNYLTKNDIPFKDIGSNSEETVRYPYYAATVAHAVSQGIVKRGILICSTGIGMANKFKGARASLCTDTYMAKMTRKHNDSNILCLGGKITGDFEAIAILDIWLNTDFEGERHSLSLKEIAEVEDVIYNPEDWVPNFRINKE